MNTKLLIIAAGIGSRFGGVIKQLEPVDFHHFFGQYNSLPDYARCSNWRRCNRRQRYCGY